MGPIYVRVVRAPNHVTLETKGADALRTRTFSGFSDAALAEILAAAVAEDARHFEADRIHVTYEERSAGLRAA